MSYTVTQAPGSILVSGGNPISYVVSSSNANQIDFKYRADIYRNGILLTTQKAFPDPNYLTGQFDLSDISQYLFEYSYFPTGSVGFDLCPSSSVALTVAFGEEYTTNLGAFSQSINLATPSFVSALNSSLSFPDFLNLDMDSYYIDGFLDKECLTRKTDNTFKAYTNLNQWLYLYNVGSASYQACIFTYDNSGTNIGVYTVPNPYTSSGVQAFGAGYPNLSALPTSSYTASLGSYPMMNSSVAAYVISFGGLPTIAYPLIDFDGEFIIDSDGSEIDTEEDTPGDPATVQYLFNVSENCGKFAPGSISLEWVNTLGAVDSFLFNKMNQTTATKTTSQYKKVAGKLNANGTYTYNGYNPQKSNYYTEIQETTVLNTDWLDDSTILYLKDLFSSPLVWMRLPSGQVFSVNVKDDSYVIKKRVVDKLKQLTLTVENGYSDFRQKL